MFGFEYPCPFSGNLILRLVVHLLLHPWFYSGFFKLSALNCGNSLEFLVLFVFFSFFFSFSSCWPTLALSHLYSPKLLLLSYSLGVSLLNFLQLLLVTPATFSHTKLFSLIILFLSFHFFISLILHWHKLSAAFVYHNSSIIIPLTQSVFIFSFCNLLCQASIAFLLCYWAHYFQWGGAFFVFNAGDTDEITQIYKDWDSVMPDI